MLRTRTLIIAPNEPQDYPFDGDYLRVKLAGVPIIIETPDGDSVEMVEGEEIQLESFKRIRIYHNDAAGQTIKVIIGKNGARLGSAKVSGNVTVSNFNAVSGAFTQGRASVTNVNQTIIAANAARRYLLIQNNDAGAILRVTLDGGAATAVQGFRVQPGGVLEVPHFAVTGAINAMMEAPTGAAGNVEFVTG